jgi:hypothetical protein
LALGSASASDGPFWATAIDVAGEHVDAAGGILNTGGNVGGFLAPLIAPLIASRWLELGIERGKPDRAAGRAGLVLYRPDETRRR